MRLMLEIYNIYSPNYLFKISRCWLYLFLLVPTVNGLSLLEANRIALRTDELE